MWCMLLGKFSEVELAWFFGAAELLGQLVPAHRVKVLVESSMARNCFTPIFREQATYEVRLHAMYALKILNIPQKEVARIFGKFLFCGFFVNFSPGKSPATISNWNARFDETGDVLRSAVETKRYRKLREEHRQWVLDLVNKDPLVFLHEIKQKFKCHFRFDVSSASIFRILDENGYSKQVVERRALEIREADIARFVDEINSLKILPSQLLFLDEMSLDNRSMLRRKGWFLKGSPKPIRSHFLRGERMPVLSFLGVGGLVDTFQVSGTFTRFAIVFPGKF
eukprot:Pompholyxophrys_punicea_v1_NODE_847_length_1220_cov_1.726180.p1 type:complete len:281 gc:universal NODE_847_length_1220_cov_1.726180:176-1018(+)